MGVNMKEQHILVTGASGFIGSNLCEHLLCNDLLHGAGEVNVIGIDRDRTHKEFLASSFKSKQFSIIWDDISHIEDHCYKLMDVDTIYHLAAAADIRRSLSDTNADLQDNTVGTHTILEFMRKHDIKNLVFSSTSSLYGIAPVIPTPEDMPGIWPISQYGASKLACEAFIHAYCSLYGIRARCYRFANVVGKNMHRGVIWDFIHKLQKNPNKLEILGNGRQEKSLFDVTDCIRGFVEISKTDGDEPFNVYNLGNINTITVRKIADVICKDLGLNPIYNFTGGDRGWKGDTPYTILSIAKAQKTGWKPTHTCVEAARRAIFDICIREKIKMKE
jgi:UDP-glucose 4-epimerase